MRVRRGVTKPAAARRLRQSVPWADWVEADFPFFSSVLDARRAGPGLPANNLTPRGLIVNLGRGYWVGFDTDLLRVAAVWRGSGVTPRALAPGSYRAPDRKTPGGQFPAPEPDGQVWVANGIYAGWQAGARPSLADPREAAPSPEEVGRGSLPEAMGRFDAVRLVPGGAVLEVHGRPRTIREWMTLSDREAARDRAAFPRRTIGRSAVARVGLQDHEGRRSRCPGTRAVLALESISGGAGRTRRGDPGQAGPVRVRRDDRRRAMARHRRAAGDSSRHAGGALAAGRDDHDQPSSAAKDAYVVDDIALPFDNPWRRQRAAW